MTIWQQHRDYAEEVSRNGPYRGDCPFCNSKNTFTAETKMGILKYNCFKLSCDVGGRFDTDMTASEMESYFVKPLVETYSDTREETFVYPESVVDSSQVTDGHLRRFVSRWPILEHETLLYDIKDKRAVFPIWRGNTVVDAIGRALDGAIPKWYRYGGTADYYRRSTSGKNGIYVIVEDVISAITVAKRLPGSSGFAILGTSLTEKHLEHISDNAKAWQDAWGQQFDQRAFICAGPATRFQPLAAIGQCWLGVGRCPPLVQAGGKLGRRRR